VRNDLKNQGSRMKSYIKYKWQGLWTFLFAEQMVVLEEWWLEKIKTPPFSHSPFSMYINIWIFICPLKWALQWTKQHSVCLASKGQGVLGSSAFQSIQLCNLGSYCWWLETVCSLDLLACEYDAVSRKMLSVFDWTIKHPMFMRIFCWENPTHLITEMLCVEGRNS
jgi:hypothetical protein